MLFRNPILNEEVGQCVVHDKEMDTPEGLDAVSDLGVLTARNFLLRTLYPELSPFEQKAATENL